MSLTIKAGIPTCGIHRCPGSFPPLRFEPQKQQPHLRRTLEPGWAILLFGQSLPTVAAVGLYIMTNMARQAMRYQQKLAETLKSCEKMNMPDMENMNSKQNRAKLDSQRTSNRQPTDTRTTNTRTTNTRTTDTRTKNQTTAKVGK